MNNLEEILNKNVLMLQALEKRVKALEKTYEDDYAENAILNKHLKNLLSGIFSDFKLSEYLFKLDKLLLIYNECLLNSDSIPCKSQAKLKDFIEEVIEKDD